MSTRFWVHRTSDSGDEQPCPEAQRGMLPQWDRRTFKSPEEHDERFPDQPWLSRGTEHGTWESATESGIQRRLEDREAWFVEFDSLADLLAFSERYGELVLSARPPTVEIYDYYRE